MMFVQSRVFWRRLLGGSFAAGAVFLIYHAKAVLYPFILALLLAYLLNPWVKTLEKQGCSRFVAILLVYLLLGAAAFLIGFFGIPLIAEELSGLAQSVPLAVERMNHYLLWINQFHENQAVPEAVRVEINQTFAALQYELNQSVASIVTGTVLLFRYAISLVISPILAFYILFDWNNLFPRWLKYFPRQWHIPLLRLFKDLDEVLSGVIRGQILVALFVGVMVTVVLWFMGLPYALLFGLIAGLFDFIPYFGAILGSLPGIAVALLYSPETGLKVAVLLFLIQQIESTIIGPRILGASTGMHPLSVVFFLLLGGELFGMAGLLLAVPVAALGKVVLQHFIQLLLDSPQ